VKLSRKDLVNFLSVALGDIPTKEVASNCLATSIYAALELGFGRERFLSIAERSFDTIVDAGGLDADAEAILSSGGTPKLGGSRGIIRATSAQKR